MKSEALHGNVRVCTEEVGVVARDAQRVYRTESS